MVLNNSWLRTSTSKNYHHFFPKAYLSKHGVDEEKAGLAAGLLNTGQQLGTALGLAILSALATAHTNSLLRGGHDSLAQAATHGYQRALMVGAGILLSSAIVALLARNTRQAAPAVEGEPALELAA